MFSTLCSENSLTSAANEMEKAEIFFYLHFIYGGTFRSKVNKEWYLALGRINIVLWDPLAANTTMMRSEITMSRKSGKNGIYFSFYTQRHT